MQKSNLFGSDITKSIRNKIRSLKDLTLGDKKFESSQGRYYDQMFSKFFAGFTPEKFSRYSHRDELEETISRAVGNIPHKVFSTNGEPFKVHFFGGLIEVKEYRYVVRSGLLFDPTLMPEGETESLLVDEYLQLIQNINQGVQLEFWKWDLGNWVEVTIDRPNNEPEIKSYDFPLEENMTWINEFLKLPILSPEEYLERIRVPKKSQVVRLDDNHYELIEIIRAIHSNNFSSPDTGTIVRVTLNKLVELYREIDPEKVAAVEKAIELKKLQ